MLQLAGGRVGQPPLWSHLQHLFTCRNSEKLLEASLLPHFRGRWLLATFQINQIMPPSQEGVVLVTELFLPIVLVLRGPVILDTQALSLRIFSCIILCIISSLIFSAPLSGFFFFNWASCPRPVFLSFFSYTFTSLFCLTSWESSSISFSSPS